MKGHTLRPASRLGQDVELRNSAAVPAVGRRGEGDELTWVSVAVFEEKARALAGLAKGAEVYVEGRLSLNTWTGKDGQPAHGAVDLCMAGRDSGEDWQEPETCGGAR